VLERIFGGMESLYNVGAVSIEITRDVPQKTKK
jgi:hypothetical protein